jgi:hypothetical protein
VEVLGVKAMKFRFDQSFLLGLYLFIRQLQLSIDRSLNGDWEKLVEYFEAKTSVSEVLEKLKSISTIDFESKTVGELTKPALVESLLSAIAGRQNTLSEEELVFIFSRLQEFSALLSCSESPNPQALINLRLELQRAEDLVSSRIDKKTLAGKEFVEHFNQNDSLECKAINDLVGGAWL